MQNILKRVKKNEKGFTLIELLAVIVILAIIAVIAVPLIGNIINKTKNEADVATARQIYDAARLYFVADNIGTASTVTVATLQTAGYLDTPIHLPSSKALIIAVESTVNYTSGVFTGVTLDTTAGTGGATTISADKVLSSTP